MYTDSLVNKLSDFLHRGQAFTPPATWYFGLLTSSRGPRINSAAYAVGDTFSVVANDGITHLYKCTGAGTTASSQGALYSGAANGIVFDGTATMTEQTSALKAGTAPAVVEASYTGYARVAVASTLANFSGTQGAGTTTTSTGSSGTVSNNGAITWPAPASGPSNVWAEGWYDAASSGNLLVIAPLTTAKTIYSGDGGPVSAAASSSTTLG